MSETNPSHEVPADAIAALREGKKVLAVKLTRAATGLGLKESKELVDALIARDPGFEHSYKANVASGGGCLMLVVALAAAAAILWFVFGGGA